MGREGLGCDDSVRRRLSEMASMMRDPMGYTRRFGYVNMHGHTWRTKVDVSIEEAHPRHHNLRHNQPLSNNIAVVDDAIGSTDALAVHILPVLG